MCLFRRKKNDIPPIGKLVYLDSNNSVEDFVDLGLSVKWCSKNVNASNKELAGDYFNYDDTIRCGLTLPTVDEVRELFEKCKITYNKKRNGFDVKGVNGNQIFIPIGGEKNGNAHYEGGYFWTCSDHEEGYMEGYKYYGCVYVVNRALKKIKTEVNLLKRDGFWINVREVQRG